jgi:hypothetical protein
MSATVNPSFSCAADAIHPIVGVVILGFRAKSASAFALRKIAAAFLFAACRLRYG